MTGVNVVQRNYVTQEKNELWHKFLNTDFKQNFRDVQFNANDTKNFSNVDDIIEKKKVKITLQNRKRMMKNFADYGKTTDVVLDNTGNPIKRIVYTKEMRNHIDIDSDVKRKGTDSDMYTDD